MSQELTELKEHLIGAVGGALDGVEIVHGEMTIMVAPAKLSEVLLFLRDDQRCRFIQLIDLCGVDYPERAKRFEVVYHLLSLHNNLRTRLKVAISENETLSSVVPIFPCADWYEREAFDMYGIVFDNHPDLRRLLTDYGFEGFPLRKDFPLTGHVEVRYDDEQARVVYEPVKLAQGFRNFDYLSPWDGPDYALPGDEKAEG